jgi:hypothetical protein
MMMLNHIMPSIWDQLVMIECQTDSESLSLPTPSHATFRAAVEKTMALFNQEILGKSDAVWRHVTVYDDGEPYYALHLDPMNDDSVSNQIPSLYLFPFQAMPLSGLPLNRTMALCNKEILGKSDAVWRHVTVYDDGEPYYALHMGPASDD